MQKRRCSGRHLMVWGALFLLVWAGWELVVRAQTVWWAVRGVFNLCINEGISFPRAIGYFDPAMFVLLGYLFLCALFAILTIALRNRAGAAWFLIPSAICIGWYGLNGLTLPSGDPIMWFQSMDILKQLQLIKLIPILLILIGSCMNLIMQDKPARATKNTHVSRAVQRELEELDDDEDDVDDFVPRRRETQIHRKRKRIS